MKRRGYLQAIGSLNIAALAGCTNTTTNHSYEIVENSITVESAAIEYTVEILQETTSSEPMHVQISFTNTTEDIVYRYKDRRDAIFQGVLSNSEMYGLYPTTEDEEIFSYVEEFNVWKRESPFVQTTDIQVDTIEPGETVDATMRVLHVSQDVEERYPDRLTFTAEVDFSPEESPVSKSSPSNISFEISR